MTNSEYVVDYFRSKKLNSLIFRHDNKQAAKLDGIKDAINNGLLTATKQPLSEDYIIRATNKLQDTYDL